MYRRRDGDVIWQAPSEDESNDEEYEPEKDDLEDFSIAETDRVLISVVSSPKYRLTTAAER